MPVGPGKYDDLCTLVIEKAEAHGAIVLVFGGNRGSGFSVQAPVEVLNELPNILRTVADQIELDRKKEGLN
jgi:hypothetical protein